MQFDSFPIAQKRLPLSDKWQEWLLQCGGINSLDRMEVTKAMVLKHFSFVKVTDLTQINHEAGFRQLTAVFSLCAVDPASSEMISLDMVWNMGQMHSQYLKMLILNITFWHNQNIAVIVCEIEYWLEYYKQTRPFPRWKILWALHKKEWGRSLRSISNKHISSRFHTITWWNEEPIKKPSLAIPWEYIAHRSLSWQTSGNNQFIMESCFSNSLISGYWSEKWSKN